MSAFWNEDRLELAFRASREGIWDWDLEKDTMFYSGRMLRFLGYRRDEAPHLFKEAAAVMEKECVEATQEALERVMRGETDLFAAEPCVKTRRGLWKWFRLRGVPERDAAGKVLRIVGSAIDISKRKKAELALAEERALMNTLLENIPMNIYFKDRESRFVMANPPTAKKMGLEKVAELLGKSDWEFFSKAHAEGAQKLEQEIMMTGLGHENLIEPEEWTDGKDETWVVSTKKPWVGGDGTVKGIFGVTSDITELVIAQKKQEMMAAQLKEANDMAQEERHLLRLVIDNVPLQVYFKDRQHRFVLVNQAMANWMGMESPNDLMGKTDRDFFSEEHWKAAEADEDQIMETETAMDGQVERETWSGRGDTWVLTSKLPWKDAHGEVLGTFGVSSDVSNLVRTQRKLKDLADKWQQRNQAVEEELELAREVQQALIPEEIPVFRAPGGGLELHPRHHYQPASKLSGDFLEVVPLGPSHVAFVVCDVMGHGIRSALVVAMLRGLMEKQGQLGTRAGEFLSGLNDGLCHLLEESGVHMFASAVCVIVDLEKEEIQLSLAGHPGPVAEFVDGARQLSPPKSGRGPGLGLVEEFQYGEVTVPLGGLRRIILFTDGLTEATDESGEQFGVERMIDRVEHGGRLSYLLPSLVEEARKFSGKEMFDDDICLLAVDFMYDGRM